jgi:hypothetical protein
MSLMSDVKWVGAISAIALLGIEAAVAQSPDIEVIIQFRQAGAAGAEPQG